MAYPIPYTYPVNILKLSINSYATKLTEIINSSFTNNTFPGELKLTAEITPNI